MQKGTPPLHKRIVFWLILPVIIVGFLISGLLIGTLSPPLVSLLKDQFDADLRLASGLGLEICDTSFSYLLDLRLENHPEMNESLQNEALAEIKDLSRRMPAVHMMVLDSGLNLKGWSLAIATGQRTAGQWAAGSIQDNQEGIQTLHIAGRLAKAHVRFFPFWGWHIVSFVFEQDYQKPVALARRIVYLGTLGVFSAVVATLFFVFYHFIENPLKRLAEAADGISEGRLFTLDRISDNEIGHLALSFNSMVESLEKEKTEVRHLIDRLTVSESLFRTIFENAPVGICLVDDDGRILNLNNSMRAIIGIAGGDEAPLHFQDLFEKPEECSALRSKLATIRSLHNFQTILKRSSDRGCQVRMIVTRIQIDGREVLFAIAENIADQKKLEAQLQQACKLEAIGSLAGGVAHDFNNLLAPILGYAELLLQDLPPDDERRQSVDEIVRASMKARDIVRQLLAFSRKQTLEFKLADLNRVISDFKRLLRRAIREDIRIDIVLSASLPLIRADAVQLEQIIMNLAVNAQDAMPGGGLLTIETDLAILDEDSSTRGEVLVPGEYVRLIVSDSGHGMDKATLERIFDPFFTTKEVGRGTGFGLATVYGIVKQHGGHIWAYSEPGQGAAFKLYFPAVREKPGSPQPEPEAPASATGNETILVVEDDVSVCTLAITILERRGYRVHAATSAAECFRFIEGHEGPLHLLLTDVIMPDMNGRELHARVAGRFPSVKVLYMSGYTNNVIAHHGILDSGINFIQKPFSGKDLVKAVRAALGDCDCGGGPAEPGPHIKNTVSM